jgi:hypothetical protein
VYLFVYHNAPHMSGMYVPDVRMCVYIHPNPVAMSSRGLPMPASAPSVASDIKIPDQLLHAVLYLQEVTAVKRKDVKLTPRCNSFREKNCIVPPLFSIPETPT